jgi:PAS domain S-box-containing protein
VLQDTPSRRAGDAAPAAPKSLSLATLLSNLPGMAYRCRNDVHWTMEFVSDGCRALTGYAPEDLVANRTIAYADLIHPDDRRPVRDDVQPAVAEGRPFQVTYRLRRADGVERWVWEQGRGVYESGVLVALEGFVSDITTQRAVEGALRESEARFRSAFDCAGIGMAITSPSGRWIKVNRALCDALGYREPELLDTPFNVITHPDDIRASTDLFQGALAGDFDHCQMEKRYIHKQGHVVWMALNAVLVRDPGGTPRYFLAQMQDITERKRAEAQRLEAEEQRGAAVEALRASEERFRALIENAADPVSILDAAGIIRYASPANERVLGHAADELTGTSAFAAVHPEDIPHAAALFEQLRAEPNAAPTGMFRVRHKDGNWRTLVAVGRNLLHHPAVRGIVVNARDVTERNALEAQLRQAQKMEAVGQLAGGIAHDFNNLLTAILANSEIVLGELADDAVRQEVEVIRQTAERAAALTRQLLTFSRNQVVEPRLVDPNAVVQDTERMLRRLLGERITLTAELSAGGPVLADPGQLEQVLLNLAVNARDAMPEGGRLTIRTGDVVMDDIFAQRHKGLQPGAYVALAVEDTGSGIPAELHARIFEPFFTTKVVGQGTGLGLSMVYGLVKQWGGDVTVASALGAGATFTVYLPRQQGTAVARPEPRADLRVGGGETVLVVEDEATVQNAIRRILTRQGYTVLEARHGADALRVFDEAARPIDLVLTDLVMPEMNGRELVARLQARPNPPKVLVISGYDEQAALKGEPLPLGTEFLAKPFTLDGLLRSVRLALDAAG